MSASGQPALENAALDLDALRERSRRLLLSALDAVAAAGGGGGIRLVLDQRLSGPLGLVARPLDFRAHGVDKIYHLESGPPPQGAGPLVYFVRAEFESAQVIAAQLSCAEGSSARATLHFVPRRSLPCEKLLEEAGVYSRLAVRECHLHLLPLDKDLLSLERPCFRALYHDGDMSVLHSVASSILELEDLYGPVASLRGKGSCAQQVSRMLKQMRQPRQEAGRPAERASGPRAGGRQIGSLLLLDRVCDMVTPLLTELTYEGLLHSVFNIRHGVIDVEPELLGLPPGMPVKRELNSSDALYAQLRNRNFGDMGPLLQKLSRDVQEGQEERHAAHTVSQLRDFMRKLQQLEAMRKSLSLHVSLAERLQRHTAAPAFHARIAAEQEALANAGATADAEAALDGAIGRAEPLPSVLRLACLHSILASGLKEKKLAALHAEVLSEYGYSAASLSLNALHKVGLLRRHDARSGWPSLRKALDLVADDVPEVEGLSDLPSALSYYYSGYCPLSTRLVGWMLARAPHWSSRAEALGWLPGPLFWEEPPPREGDEEEPPATLPEGSVARREVAVVYFLGGCTYSEVSALRWLGQQLRPPVDFVVASTHMTSGDQIIESLMQTFENSLSSLE